MLCKIHIYLSCSQIQLSLPDHPQHELLCAWMGSADDPSCHQLCWPPSQQPQLAAMALCVLLRESCIDLGKAGLQRHAYSSPRPRAPCALLRQRSGLLCHLRQLNDDVLASPAGVDDVCLRPRSAQQISLKSAKCIVCIVVRNCARVQNALWRTRERVQDLMNPRSSWLLISRILPLSSRFLYCSCASLTTQANPPPKDMFKSTSNLGAYTFKGMMGKTVRCVLLVAPDDEPVALPGQACVDGNQLGL